MKSISLTTITRRLIPLMHNIRWRRAIFPLSCRVDFKTRIWIKNKEQLQIGNNVTLNSKEKGYHAAMPFPTTLLVDVPTAKIVIGDNTRINGVYIHAQCEIRIGMNCVIAAGVNIIDSNGHQVHSANRTIGRDKPQPITIEDNVWIGLNSIILKDTIIGRNSIVAAGSVVKGHFPDNVIIQGNPAIVVGQIRLVED